MRNMKTKSALLVALWAAALVSIGLFAGGARATPYTEQYEMTTSPDAVACGQDGQFQTALLAPGAYTIVAEASRAETPEERGRTGLRRPSHIGMAQVTVSADAAPTPVRIELRPR